MRSITLRRGHDAAALLTTEAAEPGRPAYTPENGVAIKPSRHVWTKNALAIDCTYPKASVTLPVFGVVHGDGKTPARRAPKT